MNSVVLNPTEFSNQTAQVDDAAIKPLPNSRKIYVQGSRPDIQIPMREISQSDTPSKLGTEKTRRYMFTILPALILTLRKKLIFALVYLWYAKNG